VDLVVVFLADLLALAANFAAFFVAARFAGFLLDFWLADFRPAERLAAFFERVAERLALDAPAFDCSALAFVALRGAAVRRVLVARLGRGGSAAAGGTISGSETRPSAASGT
jgi:hypothetical protein